MDKPANVMAVRATLASSIGAILETVDFTAYGAAAATVFPKVFFSSLDPKVGILAAFITFGVGFIARPLGGVVFGWLGDRVGRRNILLYTLLLMGGSSFLIGCLPSYASVGLAAPLGLAVLRFVQGLSLGGESTGSQLMTVEHAPDDRRGLYGSMINIGASISAALSTAMFFLISSALDPEQFLSWGWRIPFLLSVVLVPVGVYIRLRVSETPAFALHQSERTEARVPLIQAFQQYPGTVLRLLIIWCAPAAFYNVVNVFSLNYITTDLALSSHTAFLCLMGANVLATAVLIPCGALSDRYGRKPVMLVASAVMLFIAIAYFPLLQSKNWYLIFAAMAVCASTIQAQNGVQPAFFAEPFPTKVRYSGSAAAYAGGTLFGGGPTPFVLAWLLQQSGGRLWVVTCYSGALVAAALIAIALSPETRYADIRR